MQDDKEYLFEDEGIVQAWKELKEAVLFELIKPILKIGRWIYGSD